MKYGFGLPCKIIAGLMVDDNSFSVGKVFLHLMANYTNEITINFGYNLYGNECHIQLHRYFIVIIDISIILACSYFP